MTLFHALLKPPLEGVSSSSLCSYRIEHLTRSFGTRTLFWGPSWLTKSFLLEIWNTLTLLLLFTHSRFLKPRPGFILLSHSVCDKSDHWMYILKIFDVRFQHVLVELIGVCCSIDCSSKAYCEPNPLCNDDIDVWISVDMSLMVGGEIIKFWLYETLWHKLALCSSVKSSVSVLVIYCSTDEYL